MCGRAGPPGAGNPVLTLAPPAQADNDLPVHLKGGAMDHVLYRLTMALTLGGERRAVWVGCAPAGMGVQLPRAVLREGAVRYPLA